MLYDCFVYAFQKSSLFCLSSLFVFCHFFSYTAIQQAAVGYVYGDSTCGQRALYQVGVTGIPIYNVNNNCSTGSTALYMARQFISGGISDCVLALGFEKMEKGSLGSKFTDRTK